MSFFIYEDNPIRTGKSFAIPDDIDAVGAYLKHYDNLLFLDFMAKNPGSTFIEKAQARKEILVAERKLKYWERHPNFDTHATGIGITKLKKNWKVKE
jgi:hypothetical protein